MQLFLFTYVFGSYWSLGAIYDYRLYGTVLEVVRVATFLVVQCFSNSPFILIKSTADICVLLTLINVPLLPIVASHVYKKCQEQVSQQMKYIKQLEKLNYLKPKTE